TSVMDFRVLLGVANYSIEAVSLGIMTTKREVTSAVKTLIEGLTYHPTIHWPDYNSIDLDKCNEIAPYFKSDLVDKWVVHFAIYDFVRVVVQREDRSPVNTVEINMIVKEIYAFLKSLPRKYLFLFPLPNGEIVDK